MRFIWLAVSILAGCVRTLTPAVATFAPVGDAQTLESTVLTRDRTAALVRLVIARDVAATSPISLWNRYLCMDALGRECLETAADTVPIAVRRAVRQHVLRCAQSGDAAGTLVQFSRARMRGDSIEIYVSLTSGEYGQPGDQTTYRIRGATHPMPESRHVASIMAVYHAQIIRGQPGPGVQLDDTCHARDDAAEP